MPLGIPSAPGARDLALALMWSWILIVYMVKVLIDKIKQYQASSYNMSSETCGLRNEVSVYL